MQPAGTSLVNTSYFTELTAQINAVSVCSELQALANRAIASIQAEVTSIEAQIKALLPLTTLPTDLPSVIKWITAFADPLIRAYENYAATLAQILAAVAMLTQAIENAAGRLVGCVVSVPAVAAASLIAGS